MTAQNECAFCGSTFRLFYVGTIDEEPAYACAEHVDEVDAQCDEERLPPEEYDDDEEVEDD